LRTELLCSLLLVAAASASAFADDKADKAKAKALYDEGLKHYNVSEWDEAIKAWRESYLLSKKPLLLFNIAQAYRLSGDCKQALEFYDSYQREEANPKNQKELEQAIALCPKDEPKPAEPPTVTPPPQITMGPTVEQPPPVDTVTTTTGGGLRKIGIGVGAAGIVTVGVGVFFGLKASKDSNLLDGFHMEWGPDQQAIQDRGERRNKLFLVFTGVGAAAAIAGGVMFAIGGPKTETNHVTIAPTKGGAAVGWAGRF
jgi:tetratricopeptide (TPR) repeat protein